MKDLQKKTCRYEFPSKVRYSEIDHRGTMTLPALINYFQDCSTFHSEEIGCGMDTLKESKKAWVLAYWQIIVDRYPTLCENITVGTFSTGIKAMFGNRNFYMKDEEGNQIACANSIWVYMDLEKGRPARVTKEQADAYGMEAPLDMPYEDRKIEAPDHYDPQESFPVRKYHIDTNEHVNNCQYVQMALETLSRDFVVKQVRVDYKKSAVLGDFIYPYVAKEEGRTVVNLCDETGSTYALVELK